MGWDNPTTETAGTISLEIDMAFLIWKHYKLNYCILYMYDKKMVACRWSLSILLLGSLGSSRSRTEDTASSGQRFYLCDSESPEIEQLVMMQYLRYGILMETVVFVIKCWCRLVISAIS